MINKIIRPLKDGKGVYQNNGTCAPLVNYLTKEDKKLGEEREYFFNHENDIVTASQVENTIDNLRKGLGKDDTKFYSLVCAPTEEEIKCMKDPRKEMRDYTRSLMEIYAANFNGINKEKNLKGKDIAYFAKIEFDRYYKGTDKEVKEGIVKQGDKKPGNNLHVHIVVARKDKSNTHKISPLVKNKKLFHIEGFKLKSCYKYDETYKLTTTSAKELERMIIKRDGNDLGVIQYEAFKPKLTIEKENDINTSTIIKNDAPIVDSTINDINVDVQLKANLSKENQLKKEELEKLKNKKDEDRRQGPRMRF